MLRLASCSSTLGDPSANIRAYLRLVPCFLLERSTGILGKNGTLGRSKPVWLAHSTLFARLLGTLGETRRGVFSSWRGAVVVVFYETEG